MTVIAISAAIALSACTSGPAADRIDAAETSLLSGDLAAARRGAENILAGADTAMLTVPELCRLSLVYATVGQDNDGTEADIAMAARCLRRALAIDSAAVDSFIHNMPVEQRPLMALAVQLCNSTASGSIIDYEDADALNADTTATLP